MSTRVVYAALGCVLAMTVSYLSDFYPVHVAIGSLAVIGYTAFVEAAPRKRQPPREPWYMRE